MLLEKPDKITRKYHINFSKTAKFLGGSILLVLFLSLVGVGFLLLRKNTGNTLGANSYRSTKLQDIYQSELPNLKSAVNNKPKDPQSHRNYAEALYAVGSLEKAKEQYTTEISLNKNDPTAYTNLANTYRDLGKYEDAIKAYNQAIELNPKNITAYLNIVHLYAYTLGKQEAGIAIFKDALEKNPNNTILQQQLAFLYERNHETDQALAIYKTILKAISDNAVAQAGVNRIEHPIPTMPDPTRMLTKETK